MSRVPTLELSLLATGFPYDRRERRRYYLAFWEAFMMRTQGVRRTGSAALDLAYVACGRTDGFWEFGLKQWDVAAGALIVEEAGGHVSNMDGSRLDIAGANIIATNGRLHQRIIETLNYARPKPNAVTPRCCAKATPRTAPSPTTTDHIARCSGRIKRSPISSSASYFHVDDPVIALDTSQ